MTMSYRRGSSSWVRPLLSRDAQFYLIEILNLGFGHVAVKGFGLHALIRHIAGLARLYPYSAGSV